MIQHNKKKRFISTTRGVYEAVTAALRAGETVNEGKVFDLIRQEKPLSSFSSCTCSGNQNMPTHEEEELQSKLTAMEHEKEELNSKFKAMEQEEEKDAKARVARLVATLKAMDEDDQKEHIASIKACDDPKEAKAMEEAEKEVKTAKGKHGMEHDDEHPNNAMEEENKDMKARIIKLEENEAKPLVAAMAKARETKGASTEEITAFTASMEEKSLKEIKSLYANELIFIESVTPDKPEAELKHFSFMGSSQGNQLSGKSLQEIFQEVSA